MDNRQSDEQAPNPAPPSQQGMNREEESVNWQQQQQQLQQQQLHASRGGGAPNLWNPRDGGGGGGASMNMMPPFQQERMMMGPDLRYLQEMLRNEEMIMAANRGGVPPMMPGDFAASNNDRYPEGHVPHHRLSSDGGHGSAAAYGSGSGDSVARRGLVMPPLGPGNNPFMLLSLLQSEQQRLAHVKNKNQVAPESWMPSPKRQRLAQRAGMEPGPAAWIPQQQQPQPFASVARLPEPKQRKRHVKSFPMKLMDTINEYCNDNVVAWLPDGRSFVVVDPDLFVQNVLSPTFKGGKYSSFVRKLNRWGFSRLISGTGMDCFHNSLFQRDRPDLCGLITSNPDRNDAVGVDPNVLGGKPSLAGIEKYFEKQGKEVPKVNNEEAGYAQEEQEQQDDEEDDQKPAAAEESDGGDDDDDAEEEATNVESV